MSDWIACLDADVLISMPDCDLLLELAQVGLYSIRWSPKILSEVEKNLPEANPRITPELVSKRMATMRKAFPDAMEERGSRMAGSVPAKVHPKDIHVVATALIAKANVIVTNNIKDFAADELCEIDVLVQSADTFLLHQATKDPLAVANAMVRITGRFRTPTTVEAYLERIVKRLPHFGAEMQNWMSAQAQEAVLR